MMNEITREDIAIWQETIYKFAEYIAAFKENKQSEEVIDRVIDGAEIVLQDMAFLISYVDSTLKAVYSENTRMCAEEMQKILREKIKGYDTRTST